MKKVSISRIVLSLAVAIATTAVIAILVSPSLIAIAIGALMGALILELSVLIHRYKLK